MGDGWVYVDKWMKGGDEDSPFEPLCYRRLNRHSAFKVEMTQSFRYRA